MLLPFPSFDLENITLFRGGKRRARRNALKNVTNSIPVITILKRPSPTPPARQPPVPAPPLVKILMNPKRQAAIAHSTQAPPPQDASPAPTPAPKAQSSAHVTFAVAVPEGHSPHGPDCCIGTALSAPRTGFRPERMVQIPKVIIHEPAWWDQWTDVDHPGTSYGEMLDVPPVNWRGKLGVEDFARFFPKEWFAEQMIQKLRELERSEVARFPLYPHGCAWHPDPRKPRFKPTFTTPRRYASPIPTEPPSLFFL